MLLPVPDAATGPDYEPPLPVIKIVAAIRGAGLDPRELETELGLPPQRIYRWEAASGEPTGTEIYRLARRLGVSVVYLVNPDVGVLDSPPGFEGVANG